jgi:hypothetical protein
VRQQPNDYFWLWVGLAVFMVLLGWLVAELLYLALR